MNPLDQNAWWLWSRPSSNPQNSYTGFRHDFEMKSLPKAAPFHITADQSYRLWVNGQYVCRGPLRSQQSDWYYDTVELLPFLKPGKNWISVEVHNPGLSHYSYAYRDRAGFLCSAKWDNGTTIASRLTDWLVFRNTAYNFNTGRISVQLGFQEELDLRADDRSWITEGENFTTPPVKPWFSPNECPQGTLPWTHLSPRPTEMLVEELLPPASLLAYGKGKCDETPAGEPFPENNFIRRFASAELCSIQYSDALPEAVKQDHALIFSLPASESGTYSAVLLDLGRLEWLPGSAEMEVDAPDSESILDLASLHYVPEPKISFASDPSGGSLVSPGARFHLRKGHNVFSTFQVFGTRFVALILRGNQGAVKIAFRWRSAVSPIRKSGNFQCADAVLNEIYALSVHTQQCCSMDTFVDTPWREQAQWWGDARVQAKNTFFLSGDSKLLCHGIHAIAGQPGPEGLLFAMTPTTACGPVLPDYCLTWIQTLYDFYFQTGRTDVFAENKEKCDQILDYFNRQRGEDGLIRYDKRFWLFEDWAPLPKRNSPAFLNLLFLYTRQFYKKMLEITGFHADAEKIGKELEADRLRIARSFPDPQTGLIAPEINEKGERSGVPTVHDQVLALLCDLCLEHKESMLQKRILPCLRGELPPEVAQPSSFWATYLLQAAQKYHLYPEALGYLRRRWEPMIFTGTAWENFTDVNSPTISVCHAWSGHPVYHLPEIQFGLRQTAPRWQSIELAPQFLTDCADFELPTPCGMLKCRWDSKEFSVEIPDGMNVELQFDGAIRHLTGPAVFQQDRPLPSPGKGDC